MRLNGPFSTRIHNVLAVTMTVGVGVAGLYISLWDAKGISLPFVSDQKDSGTIAGLQNLGNNCFLNVILQALASSSCFLSFLQRIMLSDDVVIGENDEKMLLTVALSSLLEELRVIREEESALSPRRVMIAMSSYVDRFNLTRQQDAAEAFIHLLSALEEEISECYVLHDISLAAVTSFSSKIYKPNKERQNECERWKNQFLGPFDGTIGSYLTCKSCSSMLSMDFEFFRCLPLSPVVDRTADIMAGCSVMDCFKHFAAIENVENYRCGQCWHASALKYLSEKSEKDEERIKKLERCVDLDSCDCSKIFVQDEITWTGFSHVSKRLSIARNPKILCIHLQRASMNEHGEFVKLQGHISFPLLLDLFPFMRENMEEESLEDCIQKLDKQQPTILLPQLHNLQMHQEIHMIPHIYRILNDQLSLNSLSRNLTSEALKHSPNGNVTIDNKGDGVTGFIRGGLNNKVQFANTDGPSSSKRCMYRLSSIVEHYGMPGSGHYAVYRRLCPDLGSLEDTEPQWFYVSDREVSPVSEATVLAAEASLLFYDIIDTTTDYFAAKAENIQL